MTFDCLSQCRDLNSGPLPYQVTILACDYIDINIKSQIVFI